MTHTISSANALFGIGQADDVGWATRAWRVVTVLLAIATLAGSAHASTISNGAVALSYHSDPTYGLVFDSVGDATTPAAFATAPTDLWEIEFRDVGGSVVTVRPSGSTFSFSIVETATTFDAQWTSVTAPAISGESFDVEVHAEAKPGDKVVELTINVTTRTPSFALYELTFPRIEVLGGSGGTNEILTYPYAGGWLFADPVHNPAVIGASGEWQEIPGALTMQWLSYYDSSDEDAPVLFAGTRDATNFGKRYAIGANPAPGSWEFAVQQTPENNLLPDGDFAPSYPFVLGVLRGDWFDAARYYRAWAIDQPWADKGPMRSNGDFSEVLKNAHMFNGTGTTNASSDYQFWTRDLEDQHTLLGVNEFPIHVYGWHNNPFDANWGDWFPIKAEFTTYGPQVTALGDAFAPYFINLAYNQNIPSYTNPYVPGYGANSVADFGLMNEDGNLATMTDVPGNPATIICLATDFADDYTQHVADRLYQEADAQGIYLDVYSFGGTEKCYDPTHGHPIGGGNYYTTAKVQLVQALRDTMRSLEPEYFTYSEAQGEAYVGVFELVYPHHGGDTTGDVGGGVPAIAIAPLYQTVYHDYQIVGKVGPIHQQTIVSDAIYMAGRRLMAAHVFFGNAPWAGSILSETSIYDNMNASPAYETMITMFVRMMSVLKVDQVRRYVTFGERMRDPGTNASIIPAAPVDAFLPYTFDQPLVYTSAYEDPDRHGLGLLFTNWTTDEDDVGVDIPTGEQTILYDVRPADYGLLPGTYLRKEYRPGDLTSHMAVDLVAVSDGSVTVPERSSVFLRFIRAFDFDNNGWVTAPDYSAFSNCFTGPGATVADGPCEAGDFDGDGDIDCSDWDEFTIAWQGTNDPPRLPACNDSVPAASAGSLLALWMAFLAIGTAVIGRTPHAA